MPVKTYNCIIINHATGESSYSTVGVLRGVTEPLIMDIKTTYGGAQKYNFPANDSSAAVTLSGGLFASDISFFGCFDGTRRPAGIDYSGGYNLEAIANSDTWYNSALSIIFPGGCCVGMSHNGYSSVSIEYSSNKGSVLASANHYQLIGLMSDSVYAYESPNSNIVRQALMHPVISPFTVTNNGNTENWFTLGVSSKSSGYTYYYPLEVDSINPDSSETSITNFYKKVGIMSDFWNTVEAYNSHSYFGSVVSGAGGNIMPKDFYAAANEPRMFTVTPDQHHAIHSVTAYNTTTNQQIPLQESAMNLLTGAKSYMFTMPAANVRIIVEFRSIEITIPVTVSYTSPRGRVFTTSFNLLYDDSEQREETAPPVEEQQD